jgi:hypothetical protein
VSVQPLTSKARVHPGGSATYVIWVWSTRASTKNVTVRAAARHVRGIGTARFSVCPNGTGATCALGNLPRGRADELQARVKIRKAAHPGQHVTLTAKATAKGAVSFTRVARSRSSQSTARPATPAADPVNHHPRCPRCRRCRWRRPLARPARAAVPTVSPQPSNSSSPAAAAGQRNTHAIKQRPRGHPAAELRLIGGQLAGLVVLAAAITMAIARLSPGQRPQDGRKALAEARAVAGPAEAPE